MSGTDRADVRVLPPVLLLIALAAAAALRFALPSARFPWPVGLGRGLGFAVIAAAVALAVVAVRELHRHRTTIDVRGASTTVVRSGPFGRSRNPVYVAMLLLVTGTCLALDAPVALLAVPALGVALSRLAIRPEERYLTAKFGADYRAYTAAVRRWL